MTELNGWEQQPGGLWLKVSPFDQKNAGHEAAANKIMRASVQTVARTHGAAFSEDGFHKNMQAVYNGDLIIDLYLAKWDLCVPKSICVGAALGWETYGFMPGGQLARSFYTEDVCILKRQLRQLIGAKPVGKQFPDDSLTECLERINLQQMRNQGLMYRFGEVDADNTTMMRQLNGNGANMGTGYDSAVLEYKRAPDTLLDKLPMDVKVMPIRRKGVESKKHFLARYNEGPHDLRFIVTMGQSTAQGQRRVDIKAWHNGNLPEPAILDCVINSTLLAIKRKVEEPTHVFGEPMPEAHIFVQNDLQLMQGFQSHGAAPRLFGNKLMMPGVNILKLAA